LESWGGNKDYSLGGTGNDDEIGPGTLITLELDCDLGTLGFTANNDQFLKINVPKSTTLYPWVYMYNAQNSVTWID